VTLLAALTELNVRSGVKPAKEERNGVRICMIKLTALCESREVY
jgi:hypothetical protein